MPLNELPVAMTIAETAAFLRVETEIVIEAVALGDLPLVVVDGDLLVNTEQLLAELGVRRDPPVRLTLTERGRSV